MSCGGDWFAAPAAAGVGWLSGATVVVGPPGAGKSTWVWGVAAPGDLVVDLDRIVVALSTAESGWLMPSELVAAAALDARRAAVKTALLNKGPRHAYVIHACPTVQQLKSYPRVVVMDPGRDVVAARLAGRPESLVHVSKWYDVCLPAYFASGLLDQKKHEAARERCAQQQQT